MADSTTPVTLAEARAIIDGALAEAARRGLQPLAVAVYDPRGALKAFSAQEGTSLLRGEIAMGKAIGALSVGRGSRWLNAQAEGRPHFVQSLNGMAGGRIVPVPGGVLILRDGVLAGAAGISGDTSDEDEACAVAGITAAGLVAQTD